MDFAVSGQLIRSPLPPIQFLFVRSQFCSTLCEAFRPHLAVTPLRFASTSPPPGCAGDFHPQAVEHARHTKKSPRQPAGALWVDHAGRALRLGRQGIKDRQNSHSQRVGQRAKGQNAQSDEPLNCGRKVTIEHDLRITGRIGYRGHETR